MGHALELLAELGDEAKILAGGQSLVPMMNFRLARPGALVDVNRVTGLGGISADGRGLRIGALTRHHAIGTTTDRRVWESFAVLPRSAHWVGHYPIRCRGTFGGSLAHADPTSEWCLLALLLDARMVARSTRGERRIPVADWFEGFLSTALRADEMLVEVELPRPRPRAALTEYALRRGDFAIVAAAAAADVDSAGRLADVRVALGGVAAVPLRIPEAEAVLEGEAPSPALFREAGAVAARQVSPTSDVHGSADYRRRLAMVLTERALGEALGLSVALGDPGDPLVPRPAAGTAS